MSFGTTGQTRIAGEQSPFLQDLWGRAQQMFGQSSPGTEAMQQFAGGGAQDIMGEATGAWKGALQADPTKSPFFQSAVGAATRPMVEQFTQSVIPQLRSGAVAGGTFGGSRRGLAEGMGAEALARQMGDVASQMGQQAYGQGMQARTQALGMAPQMMQMGFTPGQMMEQARWGPLSQYAGIIGGPAMTGGGGWQIGLGK